MSLTSYAVVLERFCEPLAVREFPVPSPPEFGMVIATRYGGICGTDLHLHRGHLDVPVPLVLGHEGIGVVHELGEGTTTDSQGSSLRPGDQVMWASSIACGTCMPCMAHREPTLCENRRTYGVNRSIVDQPSPLTGSWAEFICLSPGTAVFKVPVDIDPIAAMSFACAGPTMVHALFERRPVRLGETVVVQGSGPVGLAAAALAQLAGAGQVIVIGGPAQRLTISANVGIGDYHIDIVGAANVEDALDDVAALTGGHGADLVIECTGVPTAVGQGLRLVRRGGSYLIVGQYTDSGDEMINPHQIVYRQMDVYGSWAFTGSHLAEYMHLLPELCARFDLSQLVTAYPLLSYATALEDVASGAVMKAVIATTRT